MNIKLTTREKQHSKILREFNAQNFLNNFEIDQSTLNKKIKLDTGSFCNARCNFCYYFDSLTRDDRLSIDETFKLLSNDEFLKILKEVEVIEFSGGEPTLVKNLQIIIKLIYDKALELGNSNLKFGIVTNGWNLKSFLTGLDMEILKLIDTVLISLHGNKKVHENITKLKGSYDRIIIATQYIKRNFPDIKIRINVVLTGQEITLEFLNTLNYFINSNIQINLLPLNHWEDANKLDSTILQETNLRIYKSINDIMKRLSNHLNNINSKYLKNGSNIINIRYARPCLIDEEYHKYIVGHFGHFFDKLDWNKLWYPNYSKEKNIFKYEQISKESILKQYINDAELSHTVDNICKKCPKFKDLTCDGQKIDNQKENYINVSHEDIEYRKIFIKKELNGKNN